jgi:hypothetical protein
MVSTCGALAAQASNKQKPHKMTYFLGFLALVGATLAGIEQLPAMTAFCTGAAMLLLCSEPKKQEKK